MLSSLSVCVPEMQRLSGAGPIGAPYHIKQRVLRGAAQPSMGLTPSEGTV